MVRVARTLFTSLSLLALTLPGVRAQQEQADPAAARSHRQQTLDKAQKKKIRKTLKELDTPYKQWLNEDVVYIISPEERNAFLQLATNEEREQFIEQFWLRRSTNPDLPDNEFKEEHYRRIAYANEHYASGIPGWKTDRGRMYIMWGPPDEIESHPTGGTYDRPMEEGGGSTTTYPWETWRYRYMEGIGENVIMEFVDPSGSGEYHLTMDPAEKDALLHVPGAGLSLMEADGHGLEDGPIHALGRHEPADLAGRTAGQHERIQPPGAIREGVQTADSEVQGPGSDRDLAHRARPGAIHWRTDFLKVTNDTVLVPVTVQVPNNQLSFQSKEGVHSAS